MKLKAMELACVATIALAAFSEPLPDGNNYTEKVGDYTWTFSVENGEATIGCVDDDGNWEALGTVWPAIGALDVPFELGGCPVTGIGPYAFTGCEDVTSVTIPESVTSIGYSAFYLCERLESVTIPSSVTNIGGWAFSWCSDLHSVRYLGNAPECGVRVYDESDNVANYVFSGSTGWDGNPGSMVVPATWPVEDGLGARPIVCLDPNVLHTVKFKFGEHGTCAGGEQVQLVSSGSDASLPEVQADPGWEFIGWSADCTWVSADMTVYALYKRDDAFADGSYEAMTNGCVWSFTVTNGRGEIVGCRGGDASTGLVGALVIPSELGGRPVTSIGKLAFRDCTGLASMTIPEGVTRIGAYAFRGCSGLTSVTIPEGVTSIGEGAFSDCTGLTSVKIPEGVMSIRWQTFWGCAGLKTVEIPSSVTSIGSHAFSMSGVRAFSVASGNARYASIDGLLCAKDGKRLIVGINGTVVIPDGVTSIGEGAFEDCAGLESVTIPSSVTNIGEAAFCGCYSLKSVVMSSGVTCIGGVAFGACVVLESVTIPSSVTNIGDGAFDSCISLRSVTGGEGLMRVGGNAFCWTPFLYGVDLLDDDFEEPTRGLGFATVGNFIVGWWGWLEEAWDEENYDAETRDWLWQYELAIPDGITGMVDYALSGLPITSVEIPSSVKRIPESAFESCELRSIKINEGVEEIGANAFCGCHNLESVTLPASVTSIEERALSGCLSLTNLVVRQGNIAYKAENGCLLTADGTSLLLCAGGVTDARVPEGVTHIAYEAFCSSRLLFVTLPASVRRIGLYPFFGCWRLISVCFEGNVPEVVGGLYEDSGNATTYVRAGTSGWGEVPGEWQGRPIKWWTADDPSPIPIIGEDATAEEVLVALNGSGDEKLVENIRQACEDEGDAAGVELYNAYRTWAGTVKGANDEPVGLQAVRDSATAWTSFALNSSTLLERNPTDEDLKVEEFKPSGEDGKFDFTVHVEGAHVGSKALAANLKRTFGLEGAAELVPSSFDEANVDIEFGQPVDGNLKFTATPTDKTAKSFFMKMKVR